MVMNFVQDECCKPYPPGSLPISNLAGFFSMQSVNFVGRLCKQDSLKPFLSVVASLWGILN